VKTFTNLFPCQIFGRSKSLAPRLRDLNWVQAQIPLKLLWRFSPGWKLRTALKKIHFSQRRRHTSLSDMFPIGNRPVSDRRVHLPFEAQLSVDAGFAAHSYMAVCTVSYLQMVWYWTVALIRSSCTMFIYLGDPFTPLMLSYIQMVNSPTCATFHSSYPDPLSQHWMRLSKLQIRTYYWVSKLVAFVYSHSGRVPQLSSVIDWSEHEPTVPFSFKYMLAGIVNVCNSWVQNKYLFRDSKGLRQVVNYVQL
jgi:hypothetical protein